MKRTKKRIMPKSWGEESEEENDGVVVQGDDRKEENDGSVGYDDECDADDYGLVVGGDETREESDCFVAWVKRAKKRTTIDWRL